MWIWLSSGLFLGWSLGANDAANVFGTAVASRMVRFATAAPLCMVFVLMGGLVNGPAAMETLGQLGRIETPVGAFMSALAAGIAVAGMTWAGLPTSTSQAVVGSLIGYQFSHYGTLDPSVRPLLRTVVLTWMISPVLAGVASFTIYRLLAFSSRFLPMPLLLLDRWLRLGLLVVGCYGAWSLGGNNMANVVGFYVRLDFFSPVEIGPWTVSQPQILAFFGGLAISLGVATFSSRVMLTVGRDLVELDAITAFIATLAEALVVDFFAHSWKLGPFLLPPIPVSASQALVGGVLGVGLARGMQNVRMRVLSNIVLAWIATPVVAAGFSYLFLLILMRFV